MNWIPTTLDELVVALARATTVAELFPHGAVADYRRLAKLCHPDRFPPGPRQDQAHRAFVTLTEWYERAIHAAPIRTLISPQRRYVIQSMLGRGDLTDVYHATGDGGEYVLKICRPNGGDSLLLAEFRKLRRLADRAGTSSYTSYFPGPIETFVDGGEFAKRRVNVLRYEPGYCTLETVRERYPLGVDARHLAWIFKRMLVIAGFAAECGFVHGGLLPPHLLVHAEGHGLKLVDWTQSVAEGRRLSVVPTRFRDWYPPEVRNKEAAGAATDIYLAAKCLIYAAGGDAVAERWPPSVPLAMRNFVNTCLYPSQRMRPQLAWRLHDEFDELLERLFGSPRFLPLAMS